MWLQWENEAEFSAKSHYLYLQTKQSSGSAFTEESISLPFLFIFFKIYVCHWNLFLSWVYTPSRCSSSWSAAGCMCLVCQILPEEQHHCQWRAGRQGTGAECFCQLADQLRDKDSSLSMLALVSSQDILVLPTSMTRGLVPVFIAVLLILLLFTIDMYDVS